VRVRREGTDQARNPECGSGRKSLEQNETQRPQGSHLRHSSLGCGGRTPRKAEQADFFGKTREPFSAISAVSALEAFLSGARTERTGPMKRTSFLSMPFAALLVLCAATAASGMYHPTLGRFVQRDPKGYGRDGMSLSQYCTSDPLSFTDPNGEQIWPNYPRTPRYLTNPTRYWYEAPPLKNRCPKEAEDACKKKTLSYYSTADPKAVAWQEAMERTEHSGKVSPVGSVADLLSKIDKDVVPCSCVEKLSVLAHGGYPWSGGFSLQGSNSESWNVITAAGKEATALVESFAKAIAPVMCSKCFINMQSCASGEGETAKIIARLTGCRVRAVKCVAGKGYRGGLAPQWEGGVDTTEESEVWEFPPPGGGPPTKIMPPSTSAGGKIW